MAHTVHDLQRGRESYANRAWSNAHESPSRADRAGTYFEVDSERAMGLPQSEPAPV